jgi:GNAT superfamily N-acetyltransferase
MRIRRATAEDCPAMLELIRELAIYEKAPDEVTVDPKHFEESGFGENPVWWAFVAEIQTADVRIQISEVRSQNSEGSILTPDSDPPTDVCHLTSDVSLVAFALYYIRYSTWKGQVMYLEDLLVTESMRGNGIGKMLLDRLIEEAREKGFKKVVWQVLDWNEPAINFYKKYNASFDGGWVNVSVEV